MTECVSRRRFLATVAADTAVTVLAGPFRSGVYAANETEAALVGNLAIRAGRRIEWDGENMRPTNCSDADGLALIRRQYRKGWTL